LVIFECPNCRSKIVTPTGVSVDVVECAICRAEIHVTPELLSADAPSKTASMTLIGGRVGRHLLFTDRLARALFFFSFVLMGVAIIAYDRLSGAVPWWRDVLFFTLGPALGIGLCYAMYAVVARMHAWATDLRCSFCRKTFVGIRSLEAARRGACPYCLRELDVARYTGPQGN
jgi:DNA-directed RNA polymerase subunit RPC12/RpoP